MNLPPFPEEENFPNVPGTRQKDLNYFKKSPSAYEDYVKCFLMLKDAQDNRQAQIANAYLVAASWGFLATGINGLPAIARCLRTNDPWIREHIGYSANQIIKQPEFARKLAELIHSDPDYAREVADEKVIEQLPGRIQDQVRAIL